MFVISGACVDAVTNKSLVTTRGQNDLVLDNWGDVKTWAALAPITSRGPSGVIVTGKWRLIAASFGGTWWPL